MRLKDHLVPAYAHTHTRVSGTASAIQSETSYHPHQTYSIQYDITTLLSLNLPI
jgi:hypothetical protein